MELNDQVIKQDTSTRHNNRKNDIQMGDSRGEKWMNPVGPGSFPGGTWRDPQTTSSAWPLRQRGQRAAPPPCRQDLAGEVGPAGWVRLAGREEGVARRGHVHSKSQLRKQQQKLKKGQEESSRQHIISKFTCEILAHLPHHHIQVKICDLISSVRRNSKF